MRKSVWWLLRWGGIVIFIFASAWHRREQDVRIKALEQQVRVLKEVGPLHIYTNNLYRVRP